MIVSGLAAQPMSTSPMLGTLQHRLHFEVLVADLSARFVNLPPDQVDGAIEDAQRQIVETLDLDRATLWELAANGSELRPTHDWCRPCFPEPPIRLVAAEVFPWIARKVMRGETVTISRLDEVPPDTRDRETLRRVGTKSTVTVPLLVRGRVVGAAAFAAMREERAWTDDQVNRLRVVAQVFANVLARKQGDEELRGALAEVSRLRDRLKDENESLKREVGTLHGAGEIIGDSPGLRRVLDQVRQVATTGATVLLRGETGTGKELIAAQIHELSARRSRMMVRVNCAAIPAALLESELFGREKGAYTGALSRQIGRFELADQSTIFLDEIGDLSLDVQVKLLRAIQEKSIERLGSATPVSARRPDHRRDASRPRVRRCGADVSRGPVLPPERLSDHDSAAQRAPRRCSGAGVAIRRRVFARPSGGRWTSSPGTTCWPSSATPGPATCASCATSSSAR